MSYNTPEYNKAYRIKHRKRFKGYYREYYLKKRFGIDNKQYNNIFTLQKGCCAICGIHQSKLNKPLFVDHNHKNNKVRGLLCFKCNIILGQSGDSMKILEKAKQYLKLNKNIKKLSLRIN